MALLLINSKQGSSLTPSTESKRPELFRCVCVHCWATGLCQMFSLIDLYSVIIFNYIFIFKFMITLFPPFLSSLQTLPCNNPHHNSLLYSWPLLLNYCCTHIHTLVFIRIHKNKNKRIQVSLPIYCYMYICMYMSIFLGLTICY